MAIKITYIFTVIILFLILILQDAQGQDKRSFSESTISPSTKLTQYNGLSSPKISAIMRDFSGFIWIGTDNGINRYDAHNIKTYAQESANKGLWSNTINCLFQTKDSIIWAGTNKGLNKYDIQQDAFVRIKRPDLPENLDCPVHSLAEDNQGILWVGTSQGLYFLKNDKLLRKQWDNKNITFENSPIELTIDKNGILFIASYSEGIFNYNPETEEISEFKCEIKNEETKIISDIQDITIGPDNNLWIATWGNGLWRINPETEITKFYRHDTNNVNSPNSDQLKSISFDREGRLWIGYEEAGLDYFLPEEDAFHHFYSPISENARFEEPSIYEIFIDHEMIMWLGFRNDGVQAFHLTDSPFQKLINPADESIYQVFCLHESNNQNLIAGVQGAIDFIDIKTGTFNRIQTPNKETPVSISKIDEHNFLIGTYNNNIYRFNKKYKQFSSVLLRKNNAFLHQLRLIYHLPDENHFLAGSQHGLYKINIDDTRDTTKINSAWAHSVFFEDKNNFWATSYSPAVFKANTKKGVLETYLPEVSRDIKAFIKVSDQIFIGADLGFYRFNTKTLEVKEFNDIFPYKNIQVNAIEKDDNTGIWCSSFESIIHYDIVSEQFRTYDKTDQLPEIRFNDGVSCKLSNGLIAFGGQGGITLFNPPDFRRQKNHSEIKFTNLQVLNETVLPNQGKSPLRKNISETDQLVLKNHQNTITLNFSLLSYVNPTKHRFRYKLKGLSDNWVDLGNQTKITFTNLRHGHYTLEIQAANQDNVWGKTEILKIEIKPPFYLSWFAFALYFLLATSIFTFILKVNKAREKARNDIKTKEIKLKNLEKLVSQEHEFHQMKLRFFTNISHELRTPISLILAPLEKHILSGSPPNKEDINIIYRNAERLSKLVSQILDFRKVESGKMKLELSKGDINHFCNRKAMLFSPLSNKKHLQYIVNTPKTEIFVWFDPDKLEKIIFNLLSNAFKYTDKGSVTFSVTIDNNTGKPQALISVSDTGKGISEKEAEHLFERFYSNKSSESSTGIGLSLTRELTEIHQGTITHSPANDGGSMFTVALPLNLEPKTKTKDETDITMQEVPISEIEKNLSEKQNECKEKPIFNETKSTILIVEDNEDLRKFIKKNFEDDFVVLLASDGNEGLEIAKKNLPEIIITDIQMPVMDGIQMCEIIRNESTTSHIPLIILTAHESFALKLKSFNSGIDDYITKPFSPQLLNLKVNNLLRRRRELQKKFSRNITLEPKELEVNNADEDFLRKAMNIVQENLTDENFSADSFADKMAMSRVHLYRKLKSLTGESVSDFVRTIRLKLAANLVKDKGLSVKETAYSVGFSDPKYFSKCFKQQFGMKPTDYARSETTSEHK